jgi:hypothetical protein
MRAPRYETWAARSDNALNGVVGRRPIRLGQLRPAQTGKVRAKVVVLVRERSRKQRAPFRATMTRTGDQSGATSHD